MTTYYERDRETGLDYRGARFYDSDVGRFLSLDPLAADYAAWSAYNYVLGNPIIFVDPDGEAADWVPDKNGNLIAEKGDNAITLSEFLNVSESYAKDMIEDQMLAKSNSVTTTADVVAGEMLELDNVYTESIKNSSSDLTTDAVLGFAPPSTTGKRPEDHYNCWGAACAGSQGKKIEVGVGIASGSTFDATLTSDYISITESDAEFGKTVLRFADGANKAQHGAVFYGKSKDGTSYVYTKNGWDVKPEVMKLSDLTTKVPSYGKVKGISPTDSGYFSPK